MYKLVKKIKIYKSSAIDNISSRLLKDAFEVLIPQITYLFNKTVNTSTFSQKWKIAKVILISTKETTNKT